MKSVFLWKRFDEYCGMYKENTDPKEDWFNSHINKMLKGSRQQNGKRSSSKKNLYSIRNKVYWWICSFAQLKMKKECKIKRKFVPRELECIGLYPCLNKKTYKKPLVNIRRAMKPKRYTAFAMEKFALCWKTAWQLARRYSDICAMIKTACFFGQRAFAGAPCFLVYRTA